MRDLAQEFEAIIKKKKVDPALLFFKDLSHKERRSLAPSIRKFNTYYSEYIERQGSWRSRGTNEQNAIIRIAGFFCFTRVEYQKWDSNWLAKSYILRIFKIYIPDWFGEFVNAEVAKDGFPPFQLDYEWMMDLKSQGVIEPSNTLIVRILPEFLFDRHEIKDSYHFKYTRNDGKLLSYPETLKDHIWAFFKEESNIHWTDNYANQGSKKELLSWKQAFKNHSDSGAIDRFRLLKASLSATNMNFNKPLTSWFIDLFDFLAPTTAEMLKLQDGMLGVFNCPHSKPINVILKHFKKLCLEKSFATDDFLSNTPILLTSETKTIVTSTLMILAKLAKKLPKKSTTICSAATQALLSNDTAIQTRAAKIIAAYGDPTDTDLANEIESYTDMLSSDAGDLLHPFMRETAIEGAEEELVHMPATPQLAILTPENAVQLPKDLDDLMFMASQVFDHNDELHFDIFPAALLQFSDALTAENVDRFEPALQRAYKHVMGDWRSGIGILDHMLCVFFIDFTDTLIKRFPRGAAQLKKIRDVYHQKEKDNIKQFRNHARNLYPFRNWFGTSDAKIYKPFFHKLLFVLKELENANTLPLLSTPTHHPFWIDPKILIGRIKLWQDSDSEIGHADLQFAFSRTYLKGAEKHLSTVTTELKGEPQRLVAFLFDKEASPQQPFQTIAHWWTTSMTKNPEQVYPEFKNFVYSNAHRAIYTGNYTWRIGSTAFSNSRYDYKKNKMINFTDYRKMLKLNLNPKYEVKKWFNIIFSIKKTPKLGHQSMIYGDIQFRNQWYETNENDVKRFYGMVPNNPNNLLAKVIDKTLKYPEFSGETTKRMFINTVDQLLTNSTPMTEMTHLLMAGGLICSDKTGRSLSAELWVHGVTNDMILMPLLGSFIGKHFEVEFSPLKRFTDLIIESMIRVSTKHDAQLLILIEHILLHMSDKPIRGHGKLLEIYLELLKKNKQQAPTTVHSKLTAWNTSKSLAKILKNIHAL